MSVQCKNKYKNGCYNILSLKYLMAEITEYKFQVNAFDLLFEKPFSRYPPSLELP